MSTRTTYRRHTHTFKLQVCNDIRQGAIGRREAQKHYRLSANLIQHWLTQYDQGELAIEDAQAETIAEYEAKVAALERKVGQLTMELDLLKKTPRPPVATNNEQSLIISGPLVAPSVGGAK